MAQHKLKSPFCQARRTSNIQAHNQEKVEFANDQQNHSGDDAFKGLSLPLCDNPMSHSKTLPDNILYNLGQSLDDGHREGFCDDGPHVLVPCSISMDLGHTCAGSVWQ